MKKLIRTLLSDRFPNMDVDQLLEILDATGNLQVAAEKILGIYEAPTLRDWSSPRNGKRCKFEGYNHFTEQVTYSYLTHDSKDLYFETEEAAANCNVYNMEIGRDYYGRGTWDVKKSFNVERIRKDSCNVKTWEENQLEA